MINEKHYRLSKLADKYNINYKSYFDILTKIDWRQIVQEELLSEEFIIDFQDYLPWDLISINQKLSEQFILEFKDKVSWEHIIEFQDIQPSLLEALEEIKQSLKKEIKTVNSQIKQVKDKIIETQNQSIIPNFKDS